MIETHFAPSLIGRRRQLDRARQWLTQLGSGRGQAALVEGEPGIGKSFLVRAVAEDAQARGCQVLWAGCDELSQAFPLLPLLDAFGSSPVGAGRSDLADLLNAAYAPGNRVDIIAAATERLLAMVDELCATSPVMLVVDDLQWADQATVQTLGRLARSVPQLPLLMVGVMRPVPRRDDLLALRRTIDPEGLLRLHSLTDGEVPAFVGLLSGGTPGPRLLQLAAGAAGNPLYISELIDALDRGGALSRTEDGVETTARRGPTSLSAAIADRLEFLSAQVRGVLRAAAMLGSEFSVSDLAHVSGKSIASLLPILDEAILAGVIRDEGTELVFRHPLIRSALYEEIPAAMRAAWHCDAAHGLADGEASPERVARQLLPALDSLAASGVADEWLVRWLTGSAQQLVGRAPDVAIPLLRLVVNGIPAGIPPHDLLTCRLADALFRVGDTKAAAQAASSALAHVTRPDLHVDLLWTLAQCRAIEGRNEDSLQALDAALELAEEGSRHRTRLLVLIARTHCMLGQVDAAGQVAEEALNAADDIDDRWSKGWALGVMTIVHGMRAETEQALPLFDRALAVAGGDPALADLRLVLQINQAVALGNLDRYEAAIAAAQRVRQLADEVGNAVRFGQAQCVLGELLLAVGKWDDALAEVAVDGGGPKDPFVGCLDHAVAAAIRLHRNDAAAPREMAEAESYAERLTIRVNSPLSLARSLERECADAPSEALAVLMEALEATEEIEITADLLADAVRLAMMVEDKEAAREVTERAEVVARTSDVPHRRAVLPHCRGLLDRDADLLLKAAEHYKLAGRPLPRAQALEAAGVVLAERGEVPAARSHFTKAFALYSDLGAEWDLARTQATFRAYGIRRGPHARHRRADHGWSSLTPTEVKVARLVADGMSNPQIAAHLFLSRRTVQTHVSHILAKLNLHSRTEIAREASRRD
ncbi:helix-turn-helix transcriptional regulator [Phytohabitans aurantiacus]|uniref:LuxR family transcriptional regulator n=1 Tax=Phytohabitans aurantiacus TaxID=3016789 RepID=A0ABQ5R7D1_9ACTN|nr:LuxR family transcriptional regulator [Phytohabitans aurantiacus]GLI02654.1 LuxR family transcriptional regulator [Phytohabitans aurantiacus]